MLFTDKLKRYFVMDMKGNRKRMFATQDRNKGEWTSLGKLPLQPGQPVKVWIKDLEVEVVLCKFVFTNKDGTTGEMYLVSNDPELSAGNFRTLYKKWWSVEEYHKSLKQNTSLAKSPTRTVATQTAHLFASLLAYAKLERLKFVHNLNHFALKAKVYLTAIRMAWKELGVLKNYTIA
jgi:hypothetical protein